MKEQLADFEEKSKDLEDSNDTKQPISPETIPSIENESELVTTNKLKLTKKKIIIFVVILAIAVIAAIASALFVPSKFESVMNECVHIAGQVVGSGDYFMLDTYPDEFDNMDERVVLLLKDTVQENTLEAIRYANNELEFNGSLYSRMLETTSLMGRQSEENRQYKVSWTYHPDDGLEVTYEKK